MAGAEKSTDVGLTADTSCTEGGGKNLEELAAPVPGSIVFFPHGPIECFPLCA